MIYIASDHAGLELKEKIKKYLEELRHEIKDFGAFQYEPEDDYPDFIIPAMKALEKDLENGVESRGVVLGGSGIGECIVANKIKGIRAVRAWDETSAKMSRWHNNSNVLCLGGGKTVDAAQNVGLTFEEAKPILDVWLSSFFSNEPRHIRRLNKIKSFTD